MSKGTKREPKAQKGTTENLVLKAQKRLGKEQEEILFAVEAMKTARNVRPPMRQRIQRLVYRGT
jgi:hypothetical protein